MENEDANLLHKAALQGDMEFLGKALTTLPVDKFLTRFKFPGEDGGHYNIIYITIVKLYEEFLKELVTKLPHPEVHRLISQQDLTQDKQNAIHYAAIRGEVGILKVLLEFYRSSASSSSTESAQKPWLALDVKGRTPLISAIGNGKEDCALEIMSMDMEVLCNMVDDEGNSPLFDAVRCACSNVAVKILTSGYSYSTAAQQDLTPLHVAPSSTEQVCRLILEKHPDMMRIGEKYGLSFLHMWVKTGNLWPFQLLLLQRETTPAWRKNFIDLLSSVEEEGNNILHCAVMLYNENSLEVIQLLVEAYNEAYEKEKGEILRLSPWMLQNHKGQTPLLTALMWRHEKLALYFLSIDMASLVLYEQNSVLYAAVAHGCDEFVEQLLTSIEPATWRRNYVVDHGGDGKNVLHAASFCTETTAEMLMDKIPWLINEPDGNGERPIDTASELGTAWLVEMILKRDPSSITNAPQAWTYACKNGHLAAINAFIDHCPGFRKLCREQRDTPLHHIKLRANREYKDFIALPMIEEMINVVDFDGATPLHRAIACKDIILTEVLLTIGANRSIRDKNGKTPTDLLVEICDQEIEWDEMCKRIGINPRLRTTYIQSTNLNTRKDTIQGSASTPGEMRSTLSVVAALLATLTFAAGFTLPGGSDDAGDAILSHKIYFIVFILADTYAMCCAMIVLFCLMWSMVCDNDRSLLLIDRSVVILMQSLYGTLVAFMVGVFTVIWHKSLWAAILVFVMCSLVAVSANRSVLYKLLDKLIPATATATAIATRKVEIAAADRTVEYDARSLEEASPFTTYINQEDDIPLRSG